MNTWAMINLMRIRRRISRRIRWFRRFRMKPNLWRLLVPHMEPYTCCFHLWKKSLQKNKTQTGKLEKIYTAIYWISINTVSQTLWIFLGMEYEKKYFDHYAWWASSSQPTLHALWRLISQTCVKNMSLQFLHTDTGFKVSAYIFLSKMFDQFWTNSSSRRDNLSRFFLVFRYTLGTT